MLNIVIPMAGRGSRFVNAGYKMPKPLIPIKGIPMIQLVIRNIKPQIPHRFIFICQKDHDIAFNLEKQLQRSAPGCQIIFLDQVTQGAACTVLTARHLIDNEHPLMIANSDQYITANINHFLKKSVEKSLDGLIMTMYATDPKWSFAALDAEEMVTRVAEKEPISDHATVGIYYFSQGKDFVSSTETMIKNQEKVNGEFYVAPVYNYLIKIGKKIGVFSVGSESTGMYGLGTPVDLEQFLADPISQTITDSYHEDN